jgi:hypothetical protein
MHGLEKLAPLLGLLLPVACNGELVTLGHAAPESAAVPDAPRFTEPKLVAELASDDRETDNPTLTSDMLEIYFSSEREGGAGDVDVWTARRVSVDEPFSTPEPVTAVNTDDFETSPAISLDGLELWVGAERDGGLGEQDIWVSRRGSRADDWAPLEQQAELNSSSKDIPRQPAEGQVMPLASRRGRSGYYETFLAERSSAGQPFGEPRELFELEAAGQNTVDAYLTDDGLTLYFNRSPGAGESKGDLFVATRTTASDTFGAAVPLDTINTADDERDPWLSPDGEHLYFSSDRDGTLSIYEARRLEP